MKSEFLNKCKVFAIIVIFVGVGIFPSIGAVSDDNKQSLINEQDIVNSGDEGPEYWALLIAVGEYADDPKQNRPLMLEEVDDLYEVLIESPGWSEDHIKLIKGKDATIANIIKGLRWLDKKEDSDDISLVFITTHGAPLGFDIPPFDEEDGTDEMLVSYWGFAYPALFIWDDELNFLLNRLESHGVCLIVDSCYAGGFNDPPDWNKKTYILSSPKIKMSMSSSNWMEGFAEDVRGQGRVVLMASSEDEVSYSGGFAPYLIDGLKGYADSDNDDIITAEEVFYYSKPRASRQTPTMYDGYEGELSLIYLNESIKNNKKSINEQKRVTMKGICSTLSSDYSPENSVINGYVKDIDTNNPIEDALISVRGRDDDGEFFDNITTSDSDGFYSINVPPCRCWMTVNADGYCSGQSNFLEIDENEILWVNFSLYPRPPENSVVCGFIKDDETGEPIEGAEIELYWGGNQEQFYFNMTNSDHTGFYSMNVATGEIDLEVYAVGYFRAYLDNIIIDDFVTVWTNFSLLSPPPENAVVCGYITDNDTGNPINNAGITFEWNNITTGNSYENETYTDSYGFYYINIAAGELYLDIRKHGYEFYNPYRHDSIENSVLWLNFSLEEEQIEVDIAKPLRAIYFNNMRIRPFARTRIIGSIDIEAYVVGSWYGPGSAEKIEFYIDDKLKDTVTSEPYIWSWNKITFGKHTIKVIAYDSEGNSASEEIKVLKFL